MQNFDLQLPKVHVASSLRELLGRIDREHNPMTRKEIKIHVPPQHREEAIHIRRRMQNKRPLWKVGISGEHPMGLFVAVISDLPVEQQPAPGDGDDDAAPAWLHWFPGWLQTWLRRTFFPAHSTVDPAIVSEALQRAVKLAFSREGVGAAGHVLKDVQIGCLLAGWVPHVERLLPMLRNSLLSHPKIVCAKTLKLSCYAVVESILPGDDDEDELIVELRYVPDPLATQPPARPSVDREQRSAPEVVNDRTIARVRASTPFGAVADGELPLDASRCLALYRQPGEALDRVLARLDAQAQLSRLPANALKLRMGMANATVLDGGDGRLRIEVGVLKVGESYPLPLRLRLGDILLVIAA